MVAEGRLGHVDGSGLRVQGSGFGVQGSGFMAYGPEFRGDDRKVYVRLPGHVDARWKAWQGCSPPSPLPTRIKFELAPAFQVQGSGFRVQGSGFRVQGSGFRVQCSGFSVQGSVFSVHCSRFELAPALQLPGIPAPWPPAFGTGT